MAILANEIHLHQNEEPQLDRVLVEGLLYLGKEVRSLPEVFL